MSKKSSSIIYMLGLFLMFSNQVKGQDNDLKIFGYSQTQFDLWKGNSTLTVPNPTPGNPAGTADMTLNLDRNAFMMSQTNIILTKNLDDNTSVFINTEYLRNADTEASFGGIRLREAWINFYVNDYLQIRAGSLLPRFNRLSEIRNRVALFNYNYRPIVYEESIRNVSDGSSFVPDFASFMVHGKVSVNQNTEFVYAAYVGNSDFAFMSRSTSASTLTESGADTTDYMMVGGRIGLVISSLSFGDVSLGLSSTYDNKSFYNYGSSLTSMVTGLPIPEIGVIPRLRLGFDLSYNVGSWQFESEGIVVNLYPTDTQKAIKAQIQQEVPFPFSDRNTKDYATYYYAALTKSFDNLFLTTKLERLQVAFTRYNERPILIQGYTIGYRFNNNVVTRFETMLIDARGSDVFALQNTMYSIAIGFTF